MDIRFEREALDFANTTHDWIAQRSPERAAKWLDGLFQEVAALNKRYKLCPLAAESDSSGEQLREMLYGKRRGLMHRVLFTVQGDLIRIVAIRHAAQGPQSL
jgi:plasmid stabilization system protein ParE